MFNFFDEIKKELKIGENDGGYQIVDIGGKAVYVEGHLGVLKLSDELIMFKTKKKIISVSGRGLKLKILTKTTLSIAGEIESIEVN